MHANGDTKNQLFEEDKNWKNSGRTLKETKERTHLNGQISLLSPRSRITSLGCKLYGLELCYQITKIMER